MRSAISFVAPEERSARVRTFSATTAKPRPLFARARRLDGGVEGEEVGLGRDLVDRLDDVADLLAVLTQLIHRLGGAADGTGDGLHRFDRLGDGLLAFERSRA